MIAPVGAAVARAGTDTPVPLELGVALPSLSGEFLTGRKAQLPDVARGKVALAALGFTYDSRFPVEAWGKWWRGAFGDRPDVTFFEVPMLGGMARLGRWFIDSGMRRGTPRELHENVITVYGGTDAWKTRLGYRTPDDAYLVLLDAAGIVRWIHHGPFDEARASELRALVESLTSPPDALER